MPHRARRPGRQSRFAALAVLALLGAACAEAPPESPMAHQEEDHDHQGEDMHDGMDDHAMDHHEAGDHAHDDLLYPPVEGAEEITITMLDIDFEPDSLSLTAGEPVNLRVVNEGLIFHDLTLDSPALHVNVDAGDEEVTGLVIDEPGTYEAVCTVAGHAEAGMVLTIEVD